MKGWSDKGRPDAVLQQTTSSATKTLISMSLVYRQNVHPAAVIRSIPREIPPYRCNGPNNSDARLAWVARMHGRGTPYLQH